MSTPIKPRALVLALALPFACDREADGPPAQQSLFAPVPKDSQPVPEASPVAAGPTRSGADKPAPVLATARRYVAIFDKTADEPCPAATLPSWSGDRLFRSGDALALMTPKTATLPKPLERFCSYAWLGKGAPAAAPAFDATWTGKQIRIDADLDVVAPQMAYLGADAATLDGLAAAFRQRSGSLGSGAASTIYLQTEAAARVAVIDSLGHDDAGLLYAAALPRQRHGLAMAELVRGVRCPNDEAKCRDPLFHAQAFPYTGASPLVQPGGGPLGSVGSLAHAIGEAVIRWRGLKLPGAPLILNLSLAWDPAYGADLTAPGQEATHSQLLVTPSATVPATVQAVHAVLVYAACLDALTIAAAGNNTGGPCEQQGAMAPALWERYPTPDAARCQALFGELPARRTGDPAFASAASALVYAAGGVTADGAPIPIARVGSTPARVLPAFQAVAGAGPRKTDAWTGTSVAAATLSGISAAIWTHAPALTPGQVIAMITGSGEQTRLTAQLTNAGRARLVTGHAAFAALCAARPGTCTNPYAPPQLPASPAAAIGALSLNTTPLACTTTTTTCGGANVAVLGCADGTTPIPNVPAPSPWLRPQPDIPYCPICPVRGGKLYLSLNPDHAGTTATLDSLTLEFRRLDGSYVRAGIGSITVDADGETIDLSRFTLTGAGAAPQTIAAALTANNVTAATLACQIVDAAGGRTRAISAVSVSP